VENTWSQKPESGLSSNFSSHNQGEHHCLHGPRHFKCLVSQSAIVLLIIQEANIIASKLGKKPRNPVR
jgi:hypothetical protein